ncbi:methyl-accepting chemotaxis protein [Rhodospirillaceae bacterium KN72]|uniref:Methyl-accepting chemotaxis protein n=1 Tax=Pacificispira spongiicola TaxID=2729598 RepID=A0A7Y0HEK0_9PROT|nr:methyl-accepting chemotaxis protein [Pacificispira spongiicola]NMM44780.1 methyl-accepting chemotaxis protein [Pacificispira spongiicola]
MASSSNQFASADRQRKIATKALPLLERELPGILKEFYKWVAANPALNEILVKSGKSPDLLAKKQYDHWMALIKTGPSAEGDEISRRIGLIHSRIGLTPQWYCAGYTFVLQKLNEKLGRSHRFSGSETAAAISAVAAMALDDMGNALSSYASSESTSEVTRSSNEFAHDMMDSSVEVSIAVNESSINSVQMLYAVQQVDQQAQTISAAVEETVTGIRQISETTDQVARIAAETDGHARQGADIVNEAGTRMNEITRVVASTADLVSNLSESSRAIGDIVETIQEIAAQTNLLALNATIEAARAGEAGKGFAVVANEVKSLSNQTGRATEEIRSRIGGLLSEMDKIVASMDSANQAVDLGQTAMDQVSETMDTLRTNIADVSERMEQVSTILQEQTSAANEVSAGVGKIAQASTENVTSLTDMADNMSAVESQIGQQLARFLKYDVPHKVLRIAKSDHVIWKKRLADMISGRQALRPNELADHTQCRLGKFYYGKDSDPYRNLAPFKDLEQPHSEVHKWGIKAVEFYNNGDMEGALDAIGKVEKASVDVLRLLDATIAEKTRLDG